MDKEEWMVVLVLVMVLLALLVWWLGKIVVVPTLTVTTDKDSYYRGDTVTISGTLLNGLTPIPNQQVSLAIKPPTGDAYSLPPATTDTNGHFTATWTVPADAVGGTYNVTATALGMSATKTFTP